MSVPILSPGEHGVRFREGRPKDDLLICDLILLNLGGQQDCATAATQERPECADAGEHGEQSGALMRARLVRAVSRALRSFML